MFPDEPNIALKKNTRQVYLKTFKQWLKRTKLYPVNQMTRHLGISPGQFSRLTNSKDKNGNKVDYIEPYVIPTITKNRFISEQSAEDFITWWLGRGFAKPYCLQPGVCPKPDHIEWPDSGTVSIPNLPIPDAAKVVTTIPGLKVPPKLTTTVEGEEHKIGTPPAPGGDATPPVDPLPPPPPPAPPEAEKSDVEVFEVPIASEMGESIDRLGKPKRIRFDMPGIKITFEFED